MLISHQMIKKFEFLMFFLIHDRSVLPKDKSRPIRNFAYTKSIRPFFCNQNAYTTRHPSSGRVLFAPIHTLSVRKWLMRKYIEQIVQSSVNCYVLLYGGGMEFLEVGCWLLFEQKTVSLCQEMQILQNLSFIITS